MENKKNKTVFVTGGSRGIGSSMSHMLALEGYNVVIGFKTNKDLAFELMKKINSSGGESQISQIALENRVSIRKAFKKAANYYGNIDILINNAAIAQEKDFLKITDNDLNEMISINLAGTFICCQEVLPNMIKNSWGRIINMSSIGGQWGGENQIHYAVTKSGIIGLTRSLAKVYSRYGITINSIAPGLVATDMTKMEIQSQKGKNKIKTIPIGRIAKMDEVASVASFLAKDDSSYITGQTINVNGGLYF